MTRAVIIGAIAFVGGVGVGLLIAKLYAKHQVSGALHGALGAVGLGGGQFEEILQGVVPGAVVG